MTTKWAVLVVAIGCSSPSGGTSIAPGDGGSDGQRMGGGSSDAPVTSNPADGATTSSPGPNGVTDAAAGETGSPAPDAGSTPAPPSKWVNATGNLAGMPSECGNLTLVSAKPKSTMVIAGVARHGLYVTVDGGGTWTALGSGTGSAMIINRPSSVVYDPAHADVFWESGIYNGGGVYRTTDNGVTFQQLGAITHIDLVSVDFSDPQRKTLVAGGHEQKQTLHRSTDGGGTWTNVGTNLPAGSHFSSAPLVIDGQTHLVGCCGWGSGTCGIWRSSNGGTSWTQASTVNAVNAPLWAANGTMYWSLIYNGGMAKSTDQGQQWMTAVQGTVNSGQPIELPDARLVSVGSNHLMISSDAAAWTPIGDPLPFTPAGAVYSAQTKTFFIWHNDCGNAVLADAIMSAGFDYQVQ
jgi:hypothetical protein